MGRVPYRGGFPESHPSPQLLFPSRSLKSMMSQDTTCCDFELPNSHQNHLRASSFRTNILGCMLPDSPRRVCYIQSGPYYANVLPHPPGKILYETLGYLKPLGTNPFSDSWHSWYVQDCNTGLAISLQKWNWTTRSTLSPHNCQFHTSVQVWMPLSLC